MTTAQITRIIFIVSVDKSVVVGGATAAAAACYRFMGMASALSMTDGMYAATPSMSHEYPSSDYRR